MDWSIQSLQCAIFASHSAGPHDAFSIWTEAFQESPSNYQKSPNVQGASAAAGQQQGYAVSITTSPGRFDLFLAGLEQPGYDPSKGPPAMGDLGSGLEALKSIAVRLIGAGRPPRLAIVATLFHLVDGSSQKLVNELLGDIHVPQTATDFSFQLNVRTPLGSLPAGMNRLCRWSTGSFQYLEIPLGQVGAPMGAASPARNAAVLNLDVNTPPEVDISTLSEPRVILDILAKEVTDLRSEGYDRLAR
jgi:hypothetical protein